MEFYSGNESYKLYHGNMLDMLEVIEPETNPQLSIFDLEGE